MKALETPKAAAVMMHAAGFAGLCPAKECVALSGLLYRAAFGGDGLGDSRFHGNDEKGENAKKAQR